MTIRRAPIRRRRVAGLLVIAVVAVGAAGCDQLLAPSSPTLPSAVRGPGPPGRAVPDSPPAGSLGAADGAVPDGTTVFDDGVPGVARLDAALLAALRRAAADAAGEGVELRVDSGWRSRQYQQRLLDDAIRTYGSEGRAARWVATPDTSAHVSGDAVDIAPAGAAAWLSHHGAEYGVCQIYRNEPWHFELRPRAGVQGCPSMYADPTQDPRLQP